MDEKIVLEIIKLHFDEIPHIKRFHSENSYVAELKFREFKRIIKINNSKHGSDISKEAYIFQILRTHNIPSPDFFFTDFSNSKYQQYCIMEHLGDYNLQSLSKSKLSSAKKMFEQMGEYFAKIHSIKFEYQGIITKNKVQKKSFHEIFHNEFKTNLKLLIENKGINSIEVEKCNELFSKFKDSNEAVLCHNDFGPSQVIINDKQNKITGIIDWEFVNVSYSVADFAKAETLMYLWNSQDEFNFFKKGYEKHKKLPSNYDEIKIAYKLPSLLGILYHFKITNNEKNFKICKDYFDKLIF